MLQRAHIRPAPIVAKAGVAVRVLVKSQIRGSLLQQIVSQSREPMES
jgi:hypothetical protein